MSLARFSTFFFATFLIIDCFSWQSRACEHADRYLCRMCGLSLGDAGSVFDIVSPFSQSHRNETFLDQSLSGHEHFGSSTLVQRLQNPAGVIFDVVTIRESSCKGIGKWSSEASWFPGYSWKACVCRHCGRHLGWMFELDSVAQGTEPLQPSEAGFYAIIRENLLTETDNNRMELTREQEEFLTECEKIFADRFTDKDVEFAQLKSKPLSDPPIVRQWDNQRNQGGGDRYNQRGSHFNHRGRDHHRQWRGGYNANRERDYDSQRRNQDDRYKDRPHYDRHRYEPY